MKKCTAYTKLFLASVFLLISSFSLASAAPKIPSKHSNPQAEIYNKNGKALIAAEKWEEAIAEFDKMIAADPLNPMGYVGKAVAFDHAGNHLAAQDLYKTALSLSPDSPVVQNNLAMSFILNKEPDKAIELLTSLPASAMKNEKIRRNLALAYGVSGRLEKAREINAKDLTPQEVEENNSYYIKYAAENGTISTKKNAAKDDELAFGFMDAEDTGTTAKKEKLPPEKPKTGTFWGKPATYEYPVGGRH